MPDDLLIERAKKNNVTALNDVISTCSPYVYNLCQKWCRPPLESDDITQNALIKISKNLKNYRFESKFSTWVYSITYNTFLDEYRKVKRRENIAGSVPLDKQDVAVNDPINDQSELLSIVFKKLSDAHKQILLLVDVQDLSYQEVADQLGIELGTVRSRLARARISFKDIMAKYGTNLDEGDVINDKKFTR